MTSVNLNIANLLFQVRGGEESKLIPDILGFAPFLAPETDNRPHGQMIFGREWTEDADNESTLFEFVFSDADIRCCFSRTASDYRFYMQPEDKVEETLRLVYKLDSSTIVCATKNGQPCLNDTMLRYGLWFGFVLVCAENNRTLIHSSTIVHHQEAVLFLGESGTGKSTHTRLWLKHIEDSHLLNDDCPVLAFEDGQMMVYGSPWSGKTACFHNKRFPLKGVVRLSQAPENKIRRLPVIESFMALQPSCPPALAYDDILSGRMIDLISQTIRLTPVYHLACLPDESAAQLSCNTLFQ